MSSIPGINILVIHIQGSVFAARAANPPEVAAIAAGAANAASATGAARATGAANEAGAASGKNTPLDNTHFGLNMAPCVARILINFVTSRISGRGDIFDSIRLCVCPCVCLCVSYLRRRYMTHTYVCFLCATFNSMKALSVYGFTQAPLCTITMVYGGFVHHQAAICTTKAQCTPWCTRETIFF